MTQTVVELTSNHRKLRRWEKFRPMRASSLLGSTTGKPSGTTESELTDKLLQLCDGQNTMADIASILGPEVGSSSTSLARITETVNAGIRTGHIESIEASVYREVMEYWRTRTNCPRIERFCTGDYFTAVELSDGSQGAAINFNNVSGPHKTPFNYRHFDSLVNQVLVNDPLLEHSFLRWTQLDPLAKSLKVAVLNALSGPFVGNSASLPNGLRIQDGYLDLVARLQAGDTVAMIGCTGNYSCPEIGRADFIKRVLFSDFEYTGPFKSGIERCIERFFQKPDIVELSDGSKNKQICSEADVVIIIADTLCTNTLDELVGWSANAREVLVTGRSYAMNPLHAFERGVTGLTMQRIVVPSLVDFVERKLDRAEYGFTDSLVECFQRVFVTESDDSR